MRRAVGTLENRLKGFAREITRITKCGEAISRFVAYVNVQARSPAVLLSVTITSSYGEPCGVIDSAYRFRTSVLACIVSATHPTPFTSCVRTTIFHTSAAAGGVGGAGAGAAEGTGEGLTVVALSQLRANNPKATTMMMRLLRDIDTSSTFGKSSMNDFLVQFSVQADTGQRR